MLITFISLCSPRPGPADNTTGPGHTFLSVQ